MIKEISDLQFTITDILRSFILQVFVDLIVLANKKNATQKFKNK
jgi:hypothetical protein